MDAETSSANLEEERVTKVQDLGSGLIPPQIQYLMTLKGDQDFVTVHEWSARLVHTMLVESGFFPVFEGSLDVTPFEALTMSESQRISRYTEKLTPQVIFSDRGVYVLKYQVVMSELVGARSEGGQVVNSSSMDESSDPSTGVTSDSISKEGTSNGDKVEVEESPVEQKWNYYFSNDVIITIVIMDDGLLVSAYYSRGKCQPAINHQVRLNIEEFFRTRATMLPVKLRPNQWMRKCELNATRYAGFFKNRFAYYLMDLMDGILFERRGLISLPLIILPQILKFSRVKDVLNFGMTCSYFYEISRDEKLWEFLLKRDFPAPSHRGDNQTSTSTSTTVSAGVVPLLAPPPPPPAPPPTPTTFIGPELPEANKSETKSFYEQYKSKYEASHRAVRRFRPFYTPLGLRPHRNIGRRHPGLPNDIPFVRF